MKNKPDMSKTYDEIAEWFDQERDRSLCEQPYLEKVFAHCPKTGSILDLGCGMGQPIAQFCIDHDFHVTGIDSSAQLIEIAKKRFPEQQFLVADMRTLNLDEQFDAIIAWHSFFHLTADDQRAVFAIFNKYLKPNGVLLFTTGPKEGESWSNNGGVDLYHASLAPDEYRTLCKQMNFAVLEYQVADPQCSGATVWLVQKS